MMITDKEYSEHLIFKLLPKFEKFYENLSNLIMGFVSIGTRSIINIDTYVYSSMQCTLESIEDILKKGHINDAYALLRKLYDVAIINIYTGLYLDENFSEENFIVEEIDRWIKGKKQLPDVRVMNNFIKSSEQVAEIYRLLHKDKRYSELRDRCNNHTHYNFYSNILLNDGKIFLKNRIYILNTFLEDLENIIILHLSYLFYFKDYYMMSSDYLDCLECGVIPDEDSKYSVAPFIQDMFHNLISAKRADLAMQIKKKTVMQLK